MASQLTVDNIVGATSSDKIHIPGHVIQVVQATSATQTDVTSQTYADTGLSASITPTSTSSKILVLVTHRVFKGSANQGGDFRIVRGSTSLGDHVKGILYGGHANEDNMSLTMQFLDSPSTTVATTYKTQMKHNNGNGGIIRTCAASSTDIITLMEIAQ
jgi:hypothetical protein